ncbi:MAG: histidinol dehydrogenase [Miltoncostaeaceae bacterium]
MSAAPGLVRRLRMAPGAHDEMAAGLRPAADVAGVAEGVAAVAADVRSRGDAALVDITRRFDCPDFSAGAIRVPGEVLAEALARTTGRMSAAITTAAAQVRAYAEAMMPADHEVVLPAGQRVQARWIPVDAAGCYVPGGRAPYPSTVVMTVVPAKVAGVERIVVVTPPGPDGRPNAGVLAACAILGVDEVYAVGGPASVAALAWGTESIAPVAVVVGPGSPWVQEAKRQAAGRVGIDGIAGPSEVLIIADASADPRSVALDLLAQAEHGPDSPAVLVSPAPACIDAVAAALDGMPSPEGPVTLVDCQDLDGAVALAETFAAEHLEIATADPRAVAARITRSGAVFIGANCATAFGDYVAGSNHVLPTGGAARYASALGPATYLRRMSVVEMTDGAVEALTPALATLARAEGFEQHARSAEARVGS